MDKAHRDKLFLLLTREGKRTTLDPSVIATLGIKTNGIPVAVRQVSAIEAKTRADFNRLENKKDEYIFFFDDDKDNPQSPSVAFRAGANFKLIAAIEYRNGEWIKMPPARAAALFAEQMRQWVDTIDAN